MRNVDITAIVGDITRVDTEAIVNAANNDLWMGAGVAGAIKRAGGEEIEQEAVAKGPIEIGGAIATTAGKLPFHRIIHAAAMGFQGGQMVPASAESIRDATTASLRVADEEGLTSVAFPALGTGVGGFSIAECAEIMAGAAIQYCVHAEHTGLTRIVFVFRDEDARSTFDEAINW
jgi:O-acetyl-ADP-ribose deacetylase